MKEKRIEKVFQIINNMEIDGCIIKGLDNVFYLSGFKGSDGALFVTRGDILLLTDFRYITYAKDAVYSNIAVCEISRDKNTLGDLCRRYGIKKIGFDSAHTTYNIYQRWKETIEDVEFIPLKNEIEDIRRCKEPDEIDTMLRAIEIASRAFIETLDYIRPGKSEKEIANELDFTMERLGADRPSFETIVASGARAALPHATPTDKMVAKGEAIVIDFGAQVDGYCSDETCTVILGDVNGKIQEIFSIVSDARTIALDKAKPGMPLKELDMIVRGYIDDAGYGQYFGHGTGHGIGIAVHEAPAINSVAEGILEENMIITIEPGIYIPNLGGVRQEDMVFIGGSETKVLTHIRKDSLHINI